MHCAVPAPYRPLLSRLGVLKFDAHNLKCGIFAKIELSGFNVDRTAVFLADPSPDVVGHAALAVDVKQPAGAVALHLGAPWAGREGDHGKVKLGLRSLYPTRSVEHPSMTPAKGWATGPAFVAVTGQAVM